MKNLLNSTDIATLFLDDGLNVRRFTAQTTSIIKLIAGDVGRPSPTSPPTWTIPRWPRMRGRCCRPGLHREAGRHSRRALVFSAHHALPHLENRIDGVVITFSNITQAKTLEIKLQQSWLRRKNA